MYLANFEREYLERGEKKGRKEGESKFLMCLLKSKFGNVPTEFQKRIEQASESQLLHWGEKLFSAKTIKEVFQA